MEGVLREPRLHWSPRPFPLPHPSPHDCPHSAALRTQGARLSACSPGGTRASPPLFLSQHAHARKSTPRTYTHTACTHHLPHAQACTHTHVRAHTRTCTHTYITHAHGAHHPRAHPARSLRLTGSITRPQCLPGRGPRSPEPGAELACSLKIAVSEVMNGKAFALLFLPQLRGLNHVGK